MALIFYSNAPCISILKILSEIKYTRKQFTDILLVLMSFIFHSYPNRRWKSRQSKVKKGANSFVYSGTVSYSSDAYYLSARREQTMTIRVSSNGEPAFHVDTVSKGSQNSDFYKPISEEELKIFNFKINTDDIAILVGVA
jgi:hypothetical protein